MKRGEIRWYRFGAPDKRRPVVILARDSILEYLGEVTVAPVTSTVRDIPSEVLLSREDGMKKDCAINCDHIQTISPGKVGGTYYRAHAEKARGGTKSNIFCIGPVKSKIVSGER